MKKSSRRKKAAAKRKRLRGLRRRTPKHPDLPGQARKAKLFRFMAKELKRQGVPGGKIVSRWKEPKVNKYWELPEIRRAFDMHIKTRLFKGTRINPQVLRMLFNALYLEEDISKSRRRYREGMTRISWMINVPRKQLDRVLRSELRTVSNRFEKLDGELQAIDRYRTQLYKKFKSGEGRISSQEKLDRMAANLSLEQERQFIEQSTPGSKRVICLRISTSKSVSVRLP